jgi:hypothetical protein
LSVDLLLLILRAVTSVALLAFLGAVFWALWRDYRASAESAQAITRQRGRLVVIQAGAGLVEAAEEDTAELSGTAEALAGAEVIGASFPLLPLTSLGRSPVNTIVLNDTFCSQEHALVTWRGGQWWLEDRRSSNGTLLNGEAIAEPVVVSSGDVIGIGRVRLKIELE